MKIKIAQWIECKYPPERTKRREFDPESRRTIKKLENESETVENNNDKTKPA